MRRIDFTKAARLPASAQRLVGPFSAVAFVLLASAARVWLGHLLPGVTVFNLYYPAILASALIGGELAAALALGLSAVFAWIVLHNARGLLVPMETVTLNVAIFVLAGAFVGAIGARLRRLLKRRRRDILRLAEREARYRALFDGVSEGFALLEGVWGADGKLIDLRIIEANPALLQMLRIDEPVTGRRQSEVRGPPEQDFLSVCQEAFQGPPVRQELFAPHAQRWFDVRASRVGENRLTQIVVDITERKAAESRQTEMFDELNHRVKNNLAAVSAMLSMQARVAADPKVATELRKAVDRIETIGDVHASLYRVSSTDEVDLAAYLQRLCDRLSTSLVDNERMRIDVSADPAMAPLDEAVALGLIVNELVTNAAKYAYPAPARGVIRVGLRNRSGELTLSVSDDGQGLPETAPASGIGMRLVRSLVQQCRGRLEVGDGRGTNFTVRMREHPLPAADSTQSPLL